MRPTLLDTTASAEWRETMVSVVAATAAEGFLPLTAGGGIRSVDDVCRLLPAVSVFHFGTSTIDEVKAALAVAA